MRLINFGDGEITDRVSILALKILEGKALGRETKHFETERAALLTKLGAKPLHSGWLEAALDLAAINGALWRAEDEIRRWRLLTDRAYTPGDIDTIRQIAFRIQDLNDQRSALIESINKQAGNFLGEEKVYA